MKHNSMIISEERVYESQKRFESLFDSAHLPGFPRGGEIYIYKNFMTKWFAELSAKHRYDEDILQKLRKDFIEYMFSVEQGRSAHYLSFDQDEDSDNYTKEAEENIKRVHVIVDAFAHNIGGSAFKELSRIRELDFENAISKNGELAPDGYRYSISDELEIIE